MNGPNKSQHTEQHKNTSKTKTQHTIKTAAIFVFFGQIKKLYIFYGNKHQTY